MFEKLKEKTTKVKEKFTKEKVDIGDVPSAEEFKERILAAPESSARPAWLAEFERQYHAARRVDLGDINPEWSPRRIGHHLNLKSGERRRLRQSGTKTLFIGTSVGVVTITNSHRINVFDVFGGDVTPLACHIDGPAILLRRLEPIMDNGAITAAAIYAALTAPEWVDGVSPTTRKDPRM